MSTENIAHEKRYRDWLAQYDAMFAPENRSPQQDEQFPLTDGYSIRSKAYIYDGDLHLCGSESELLDNEGKVRYAWRNLDTDGEFCSLFRHRNGKHYLISVQNCMDTASWRWRADRRCTMSLPVSTQRRVRRPRKCSSGPARTMTLARICWLSPAASGPVPTPLSCWTFPAHSSHSSRSVGWICGTSLTRMIPGLTILSLSAGTATACFFVAATQRMTGGKK